MLKKDPLNESSENKKMPPTFDMIESHITSNYYQTDNSNERFDYFSNEKYLLVDFKTSLRSSSIDKLFKYFSNIQEESEAVLCGYVTGVLTKIHEVSNDLIPVYLHQNSKLGSIMSDNINNTSISQFMITLIIDNPWIKETDSSIKKVYCSAGTYEMAYSSVYTCKSRNDLFSESAESVFEEKMLNWKEKLEKKEFLLIENVIQQELEQLPSNFAVIKNSSLNLFTNILANLKKNQNCSLNAVGMVYQIICKLIDTLIEHSNHDFPSYINRFDREEEEFKSIWEINEKDYYVGLFNNCEATVNHEMFFKLMKELFDEPVYSNKLKNVIEFLNLTVFLKSSIQQYQALFLEECNKFKSGSVVNITSLEYLSKILVISLHFETFDKSSEQHCIQLIIDHFSEFLKVLEVSNNSNQIIVEETLEKPKLGFCRHFILKMLIHCFLINNKNFNLFVLTSEFKNILIKLLKNFTQNDKFLHLFCQIIEAILSTKHEVLINDLLPSNIRAEILQTMTVNSLCNKFIILKILKLFDEKFTEEVEKKTVKESKNIKEIQDSKINCNLEEIKQIIYYNFQTEIKCYQKLENERLKRHKRKDTDSSMFSNNILDDSDKFESNALNNLIDSDPPHNDFQIDLDEEDEEETEKESKFLDEDIEIRAPNNKRLK